MDVETEITEIIEIEDTEDIPHVFEQKCAICNQCCYIKTVPDTCSRHLWTTKLNRVLFEAFDIQQAGVKLNDEDIPICTRCSFFIGSLESYQRQLREIKCKYDEVRSTIAFSVMSCIGSRCENALEGGRIAASQLGGSSRTESLQFLIYKSWKDRYIVDNGALSISTVPSNSSSIRAHEEIKPVNPTEKLAAVVDAGEIPQRSSPSTRNLVHINSQRTRNGSLISGTEADESSKSRIIVSKIKKGKKGLGAAENSQASNPVDISKETEPSTAKIGTAKSSEKSENPSPTNQAVPEEITLAMSPELFRKNCYAITNYNSDGECSEDSKIDAEGCVAAGKLSPGERALIGNTFEIIGWVDKKESSSSEKTNERESPEPPKKSPPSNSRSTAGSLAERLRGLRNDQGFYVCIFCSKEFRHKYPFRDHVKTHTGDAPTCNVCRKIFPKHHNLMLHMRTHTGEKPYECEDCGKGFADKSNLKVHMRAHTGERPYKCEFCGMGFVNSSRLVVHRRLHTGERPFHCSSCEQSFCTKNQLQYHLKKNHVKGATVTYPCESCPKQYMSAYSLKTHVKKIHGV